MTTSKSLANQRLSLLLYAQEINNISQVTLGETWFTH